MIKWLTNYDKVPPLVGFGVLMTNLVEGLMCLWELRDNIGSSPLLIRLLSFESNPPPKHLREKSLWGQSPKHPEPKSVRHHWSLSVCVIWRLVTLEDCESSSRLGVAFWASRSHCGLPVNEVCEGLEVYLEDLPEWLGEDCVFLAQGE